MIVSRSTFHCLFRFISCSSLFVMCFRQPGKFQKNKKRNKQILIFEYEFKSRHVFSVIFMSKTFTRIKCNVIVGCMCAWLGVSVCMWRRGGSCVRGMTPLTIVIWYTLYMYIWRCDICNHVYKCKHFKCIFHLWRWDIPFHAFCV